MANRTVMLDERFMEVAEEVTDAAERFKDAKVVEFSSMSAVEARRQYGLTAQSMESTAPLAVWEDGLGHKYVDPQGILFLLVGAVKELSQRVSELEAKKVKPKKEG